MRNKIKAVRKRPGEAPEIIEIENTEEALAAEVGGEITGITPLSDVKLLKKMCARVDELPPNVIWCGVDLRGTILVVGWNSRKRAYCDLPSTSFWVDSLLRQEVGSNESQGT